MVTGQPQDIVSYSAAADLSGFQYTVMKQTAASTINLHTTPRTPTDMPVGILQDKPDVAGAGAMVAKGGTSIVVAGAAITQGAILTFNTSGRAVTQGSINEWTIGQAKTAASADGDYFEADLGFVSYVGSHGIGG